MALSRLEEEELRKQMLAKLASESGGDDVWMQGGTGGEGEYAQKGDFDDAEIFSEQFVTTVEDGKKRIWDMTKTRSVDEWADLLDRAIDVKPYDGMPFKWTDGQIYTYVAPVEDTSAKQQEPVRPGTTLQDVAKLLGGGRPDPRTDSPSKLTVYTADREEVRREDLANESKSKSKGKPSAKRSRF